jgi:hypothetical protein
MFKSIKSSRILSKLIGILLLGFLSSPVFARDYHIEVIVFERPASEEENGEKWDFSDESIQDEIDKINSVASKSSDQEYDIQLENLAGVEASLRSSGMYILSTANWIQPSAVYQHAPIVSIGDEFSSLSQGFLKVYKTSLIFVDIDLQLSPQGKIIADEISENYSLIPVDANSSEEIYYPPQYFLSEKRRLKFEEIHYFDHPKFGAILGVWPSDG